ncbi:MAG TPA: succinate dehydrogenase/fumarate reductase iron-sulfur subunit [Methanoregulaceae archaeon]|nr:succinate dehydrogenase/fumarate reductase iron-sulfur subunit [Methanoregulaceae archaeon]
MKLKVFRQREGMDASRYDTFEIAETPGMTVLGALFRVQEQIDDTLAFRYSCRGAVCGSCAMLINKVPRLACRTQVRSLLKGEQKISLSHYPALDETVSWNPGKEVLVEPLPHLPVIRDLVVDMSAFYRFYRMLDTVFRPTDENPVRERHMEPVAVKDLELYTNCILCAACFGSCPVDEKNPKYPGPAALATLYRFRIDPREDRGMERLEQANTPDGWWACEFHGNCRKVCSRGVPPIVAIGHARQELEKSGKKPEKTGDT